MKDEVRVNKSPNAIIKLKPPRISFRVATLLAPKLYAIKCKKVGICALRKAVSNHPPCWELSKMHQNYKLTLPRGARGFSIADLSIGITVQVQGFNKHTL